MGNKKKGLLRNLARNCAEAVREFPVTFVYLTAFALIVAWPDVKYSCMMTFGIPCLLACLGSLGTSLITAGKGLWRCVAGQVFALMIALLYLWLLSDSKLFEYHAWYHENHMEINNSLAGYIAALLTVIFFPFWYKGRFATDASWSTSMRGFVGLMRAGLVAVCVFIAMMIITFAGDVLLNVTIFGQFWLTFVPVMLFGSLSIAGFSKKSSSGRPLFRLAPFSRGVLTFVFVPLSAIYLLIFYLYLAEVIMTGATPVHDISYQAIGVFLTLCVQRYLFHQALREGNNVVARWFDRLSPWLLLLPVVMMSWVIGQRLMKYGLTVSRLYVMLINFWMYGVIVWWIVTKGARIWVIPVSLCAVITLSSVTCLNVTTITKASMRSDLRKGMEAAGWDLPVSDSFFRQNSWEALTAGQRSRKAYLEDEMGTGSLDGLVVFEESSSDEDDDEISGGLSKNGERLYISSRCYATFDSVPDGCVAVNVGDYEVKDIFLRNDSVIIIVDNCGSLVFNLQQLRAMDNRRRGVDTIQVVGSTGNIKGGCVSYIYISANIDNGGFKGQAYSRLTGTIFMTREAAEQFVKEKK